VKLREKKINAFGRSIPVIAVVLMLLTAGIAGAALVSVYFTTAGTVDVSAPLSVDPIEYSVDLYAGEYRDQPLTITNDANVAIPASLETTIRNGAGVTVTYGVYYGPTNAFMPLPTEVVLPSGGTEIVARIQLLSNTASGIYTITTRAVPITGVKALVLENKDASWNVIDDDRVASLIYTPEGETFDYALFGMCLEPNTEYSLIYYADKPDRFDNWGGNNPGALIATGATDGQGILVVTGYTDLNMNLPYPPDANIDEYDYSIAPDNYAHAHGAKLWLVPSDNYDTATKTVTPWSPSDFLFETDLISYTETNVVPN